MGRRPIPFERSLVVLTDYPPSAYYRDRWGHWWRVYDGKDCPPVPSARYRLFVSEQGQRLRYTFGDGEDRRLTPRSLTLQKQRAELVIRRR